MKFKFPIKFRHRKTKSFEYPINKFEVRIVDIRNGLDEVLESGVEIYRYFISNGVRVLKPWTMNIEFKNEKRRYERDPRSVFVKTNYIRVPIWSIDETAKQLKLAVTKYYENDGVDPVTKLQYELSYLYGDIRLNVFYKGLDVEKTKDSKVLVYHYWGSDCIWNVLKYERSLHERYKEDLELKEFIKNGKAITVNFNRYVQDPQEEKEKTTYTNIRQLNTT